MAKYTSMVKVNDSIPVYFDHETKTEALDFVQRYALDYVDCHISDNCVEFAVRDNTQKMAVIRGSYSKRDYGKINVSIHECK